MTDETTLLSCPFCSGEAFVRIDISLHPTQSRYRVGCDKDPNCHGWYGHSRYYTTESEAIAAWNTRAELGNGTLTAEQVRELIAPHLHARPTFDFGRHGAVWEADFQAIADELNAELGSEPNPDGLPAGLAISDDGALLNWRGENYVRQDALGSGTCEMKLIWTDYEDGECYECSACKGNTYTHGWIPNHCSDCGAKVKAVK